MFVRTDEDIAAGVIRLSLGGQDIILHTLPWEASEEWQARLQAELVSLSGRDLSDIDSAVAILSGAMGSMVDLIAAYDREHKLGRDAADLRTRYDRSQLYAVFKAIGRHEYPFVTDAEGLATWMMPIVRPLLASVLGSAASRPPSTSNGRSPTGDLTPELSVVGSTGSSSGSSGKRARNA